MSARLFLLAMIAAVVAAVISGLIVVGGPLQAQREKFDQQRWDELVNVLIALECYRNDDRIDDSLPKELTVEALRAHCSLGEFTAEELTDDETGETYAYDAGDGIHFFVCATFHDAARIRRLKQDSDLGMTFNAETGCMSGVFR
jgi:hypothetical protein